ncbi:MAG: polyphosphate kinase 1 [Niabella sp.]
MQKKLIDRDISWLSFNGRVLQEAVKESTPLLERLKFLGIYSSNLDEFYRVRMPAVMALKRIDKTEERKEFLQTINETIAGQLAVFGDTLRQHIIPGLAAHRVNMVYGVAVPDIVSEESADYFFSTVAAFIQPVYLTQDAGFFPENNKIYFLVLLKKEEGVEYAIVNIPSDELQRFFLIEKENTKYILFLDDVLRNNIHHLFPGRQVEGMYSFKVTRDAELDLQDEYEGDIAEKIEKQIMKRDLGLATRLLYDASMPQEFLAGIIASLGLEKAIIVSGGRYHNLKNFDSFPVKDKQLLYAGWPPHSFRLSKQTLFDEIAGRDILINTPYESYDKVLRFFNEAAIDPEVSEIFITLYRIAGNSTIAHALISAARNGKKVTVFVELKARFDEANNIKWAKKMKAAGIKIIYSIPGLKVHAKIALIKRRKEDVDSGHYGLLATGNFNEGTARFYTDYILMTADRHILNELEMLFDFLDKRKKPDPEDALQFNSLLVAQFNLQNDFIALIDQEIENARAGLEAVITIKLNNLEEKIMINKLYEAAAAGVKVRLVIRGICRLNADYEAAGGNICVKRIVDRYLEHGRIFIFHNGGDEKIFLGSADWMERNIYRRIEVCFPVQDEAIKNLLKRIIQIQLADNVQAECWGNCAGFNRGIAVHAQYEIYSLLAG